MIMMVKILLTGPSPMFDILIPLCASANVALLIALSVIDLKHWILPDKLNFALGVCGLAFHLASGYRFFSVPEILAGGLTGAGFLYGIRFFANRHYGRDALGLGDVKLMGAAGLWLGVEGILMAVTIGAFAGMIHGLLYAAWLARKNKTGFSIRDLSIPAGPGFATGILITGFYLFSPYVFGVVHDLIA